MIRSIETTATVNIRKTDPGLEHANIVVTSYNGIVLLSGQVPSEELRNVAAQAAALRQKCAAGSQPTDSSVKTRALQCVRATR